jgi:hypothetical protein
MRPAAAGRPYTEGRPYKLLLGVLTVLVSVLLAAFVGGLVAGLLLLPFSELFDWVPSTWVSGVIWALVAVPAAYIFLRSTALVDQRSPARPAA